MSDRLLFDLPSDEESAETAPAKPRRTPYKGDVPFEEWLAEREGKQQTSEEHDER